MFQLQPKPTFWTPISIPVPGEVTGPNIDMEFVHKTKSELDLFIKSDQPLDDALPEIVKNWSGASAEFGPGSIATLLNNYPSAAQAIFKGYLDALLRGREKNS
jgi:hypothetical protein